MTHAEFLAEIDRQIAEQRAKKPNGDRRQADRRQHDVPVAEDRRQAERRSGLDRRHSGGQNRGA